MFLVFISQLAFSFSRTLNTRYVSKDKKMAVILTGFAVKCAWLITTHLGINAMMNSDYKTIVAYLIGGVIGDAISLYIKIK